ncbi:hypothetical protein [Rubinisphaera margarita]|uniref:hypothetical protein n=1 Tax=Rubinisphaera margarita TaxID=2909586 RepID=UPI001EE972E6|nr:hypothetical protein [Rubinisphaera margarita]MCG6155032.1 hypothetical protein [Rubinisphaera margarita]
MPEIPEATSGRPRKRIGPTVCLGILTIFTATIAAGSLEYPRFALAFSVLALLSLLAIWIRAGWIVVLTISGGLIGYFDLAPMLKGEPLQSIYYLRAVTIATGTLCGFLMGVLIEICSRRIRTEK